MFSPRLTQRTDPHPPARRRPHLAPHLRPIQVAQRPLRILPPHPTTPWSRRFRPAWPAETAPSLPRSPIFRPPAISSTHRLNSIKRGDFDASTLPSRTDSLPLSGGPRSG